MESLVLVVENEYWLLKINKKIKIINKNYVKNIMIVGGVVLL
jgi:hypothetical protein